METEENGNGNTKKRSERNMQTDKTERKVLKQSEDTLRFRNSEKSYFVD